MQPLGGRRQLKDVRSWGGGQPREVSPLSFSDWSGGSTAFGRTSAFPWAIATSKKWWQYGVSGWCMSPSGNGAGSSAPCMPRSFDKSVHALVRSGTWTRSSSRSMAPSIIYGELWISTASPCTEANQRVAAVRQTRVNLGKPISKGDKQQLAIFVTVTILYSAADSIAGSI